MDASPLFRLSRELRDKIYTLALTHPAEIQINIDVLVRRSVDNLPRDAKNIGIEDVLRHTRPVHTHCTTMSLLNTCRQIHSEALPEYFQCNTFKITVDANTKPNIFFASSVTKFESLVTCLPANIRFGSSPELFLGTWTVKYGIIQGQPALIEPRQECMYMARALLAFVDKSRMDGKLMRMSATVKAATGESLTTATFNELYAGSAEWKKELESGAEREIRSPGLPSGAPSSTRVRRELSMKAILMFYEMVAVILDGQKVWTWRS